LQYADEKKTCSAARYLERHHPGCYSHPLALSDQNSYGMCLGFVGAASMKFPHAMAAFRRSLPCWSSLTRLTRPSHCSSRRRPSCRRAARGPSPHLCRRETRCDPRPMPEPPRAASIGIMQPQSLLTSPLLASEPRMPLVPTLEPQPRAEASASLAKARK
jgi:hypothetical protein